MSLNTQLSDAAANAAVNALCALANGGFLKIYSGSQPATGNAALTGTLLATINLAATAFGAAASGSATLAGTGAATIANTGTAGYFVIQKSDGTTNLIMGSIGTASCNLNLNSTSLVQNALVAVTGYTYTLTEAGS